MPDTHGQFRRRQAKLRPIRVVLLDSIAQFPVKLRPDVPFRDLDFPSSRRYLLPNARSRRSSGVTIINTDGLVLFGPGSEWLWFMLQFLALVTTFYAIYRQLRLQASQSAVEQVEGLNR